MTTNHSRRRLLHAAAALPLGYWLQAQGKPARSILPSRRLAQLESDSGGRLGVYAFHADRRGFLAHRPAERFPMCSTAKVLVVGAILQRSESDAALMDRRIQYTADALVSYSPITGQHVAAGMTVRELCAATITISDNAAANLLIRELGGPPAVTAYARSIGDKSFRLDRWETALNSAIPGDARDTTTPEAMARALHRLVLGDALALPQRTQLLDWLLGNTTGATRIRAGVPGDWTVGDKTGTGAYGSTNDIGILWPPAGAPIVVAIYYTQPERSAAARVDVVAAAAALVAEWANRS